VLRVADFEFDDILNALEIFLLRKKVAHNVDNET